MSRRHREKVTLEGVTGHIGCKGRYSVPDDKITQLITKLQISILLSLVLFSVARAVVAQNRSIGNAQARRLVLKFMQSEGYDTASPNFSLEQLKGSSSPHLYEFGASVDNPNRDD